MKVIIIIIIIIIMALTVEDEWENKFSFFLYPFRIFTFFHPFPSFLSSVILSPLSPHHKNGAAIDRLFFRRQKNWLLFTCILLLHYFTDIIIIIGYYLFLLYYYITYLY
jgi:hypothetical protein